MPPGLPTLQDAKEIAFTFDTCASHVVAWGVSAAASGALAEDWLSLPADEHASAPGGVARVVVAWLLSVPLFEFLCAAARFGPAAPAAPAVPAARAITLPTFPLAPLYLPGALSRPSASAPSPTTLGPPPPGSATQAAPWGPSR